MNAFEKFDLTGKTALVTGGGTGLGYFMTRALLKAGAKVMIAARRVDVLDQAAQRLAREVDGAQVLTHFIDLANLADIPNKAAEIAKTLNGVDIFIGNAAQDLMEYVCEADDEKISENMQVNVTANIVLTKYFVPHMKKKRWGRLIYSASIAANRPSGDEKMAIYAATKGAVTAFTRGAANEFGRYGITANSLVIGVFGTEMLLNNLAKMPPEVAEQVKASLASMTSLGRIAQGEELEGVIQLLASNAGSYVSGTEQVIDGGLSGMMRPMAPLKN